MTRLRYSLIQKSNLLSGILISAVVFGVGGCQRGLIVELGERSRDGLICVQGRGRGFTLTPQRLEPTQRRVELNLPGDASAGLLWVGITESQDGACLPEGRSCLLAEKEFDPATQSAVQIDWFPDKRCPLNLTKPAGAGAAVMNEMAGGTSLHCRPECTSPDTGGECRSQCRGYFSKGTQVTITPQPRAGFVFTSWNGQPCESLDSAMERCTVMVQEGPTTVAVPFEPNAQCLNGWCREKLPRLSSTPTLRGIWGARADQLWTVGSSGTILLWDGTSWKQQPVPPVSASQPLNSVWGIADTSTPMVWAVGQNCTVLKLATPESSWQTESIPPAICTTEPLYGTWGSSPNARWAVGEKLVLFGQSGGWTKHSAPIESFYAFREINRGSSALWAAGTNGIYQYNGSVWTPSISSNNFYALWDGPTALWAGGALKQVKRLTMGTWEEVGPTLLSSMRVHGIWGHQDNNVWAVGVGSESGIAYPTIAHYDGAQWKASVFTNQPQDSVARGIWGLADEVWTVGDDGLIARAAWAPR